jgi:hypothetical protein
MGFKVQGSRFKVQGRVPRRDVDDLVQEVFIVAYRRIGELREQLGWRDEWRLPLGSIGSTRCGCRAPRVRHERRPAARDEAIRRTIAWERANPTSSPHAFDYDAEDAVISA